MMAPLDPATLVMAVPAIMTTTVIAIVMAAVLTIVAIVAAIIPAVVATIIAAVAAVIAVIMAIAIVILGGGAAARAKRCNRETRRGENIANLHGILSLPGDRAMTGDTITLTYRS